MTAATKLAVAHAIVDSELHLRGLSGSEVDALSIALRVPNPQHLSATRSGRYAPWLEEFITPVREGETGCVVPRGAFSAAREVLAKRGVSLSVEDRTTLLPPLAVTLQSELRPEQATLVRELTRHVQGIVECPTGGGKTPIAAAIVATLRQHSRSRLRRSPARGARRN